MYCMLFIAEKKFRGRREDEEKRYELRKESTI